jgi:hypothetical protein
MAVRLPRDAFMKPDFIGLTVRRAECESHGKQYRQTIFGKSSHWGPKRFSESDIDFTRYCETQRKQAALLHPEFPTFLRAESLMKSL